MNIVDLKDTIDAKLLQRYELEHIRMEKQAEFDKELQVMLDRFNEANAELFNDLDLLDSDIAGLKGELVEKTTKFFNENTDISNIRSDIYRRQITSRVYSEEDAVAYAIENNKPEILSIKKAAFNKTADEEDLDFVSTKDSVSITIVYAKDKGE